MKSVVASMELFDLADRRYCIPASRNVSFIYDFGGPSDGLGALAVSPSGVDFAPGSVHDLVHLDFWAEEPWTDIVQPGLAFTVWYGGDVGRGLVLSDR
jgi:hypothetical protein